MSFKIKDSDMRFFLLGIYCNETSKRNKACAFIIALLANNFIRTSKTLSRATSVVCNFSKSLYCYLTSIENYWSLRSSVFGASPVQERARS